MSGSDHRHVRGTLNIPTKTERARLMKSLRPSLLEAGSKGPTWSITVAVTINITHATSRSEIVALLKVTIELLIGTPKYYVGNRAGRRRHHQKLGMH